MESALFQHAGGAGVRLIETARWDGRAVQRLDLHLERLAAGAAMLGYPCDLGRAKAALMGAAGAQEARLRLTLGAGGDIEVVAAPLPSGKPVWRIGLADQVLDSRDPFLRIKSTHRPAYDAARAAMQVGLDEVILLNTGGEVADGSITTLFFDRGQGLRTPPMSSGALPGVLRAEMNAAEETLHPTDLPHVALWVGNSLRGLIRAIWVQP